MLIGIEQARADIAQMRANVEQMRINADQMRANADKLRNDVRYESRKFLLQALVAAAACVGAGVALANWVNSRPPAPPAVQAAPPQATPRG
jgi:alanine dehydrogenase